MFECVKCGQLNEEGAGACERCTWPFSLEAWSKTKFLIKRVTVDTSCINIKKQDADLNLLEKWAGERRFSLDKSVALLDDLSNADPNNPLTQKWIEKSLSYEPHPPVLTFPWTFGDGAVFGGPDMEDELHDILFPTTMDLTLNQKRDVEHLRSHVFTGGDVFITKNPKDFIVRGKQEKLSRLGIWVFAPNELVNIFSSVYGWE